MKSVFNSNCYRKVYIVDSREIWDSFSVNNDYQEKEDLVLTFDFELKKNIELSGGESLYIDKLISPEEMHRYNFAIYDFFHSWNLDQKGNDLFNYKEVDFGISFRLDFWNDYVSLMRLFLCVSSLKALKIGETHLYSNDMRILKALELSDISTQKHNVTTFSDGFFFPISKWLDEQIRPNKFRGFLYSVRSIVTAVYGELLSFSRRVLGKNKKYKVFIQEYHPTKAILESLRDSKDIELVLCNFSRGTPLRSKLKEQLLPVYTICNYRKAAERILENYRTGRCASLVLNKVDLTDIAFEIIDERVRQSIGKRIAVIESSFRYLRSNPIDLVVLIANIGFTVTLFDCVCKAKGIPSFLIINGMLGPEYSDDSKYASHINSYSTSIRDNYFRGMDNVYALGDPRMDNYASCAKNTISRTRPKVVIGASGFNPVDLNSFVAVEFEFMFSVLSALQRIESEGSGIDVVIKVRPNGYKQQYVSFLDKFFPGFKCEIIDSVPMNQVLFNADLYISIYSQTLFEASILGVPVIYYRADSEVMFEPFDMNSELLTVSTPSELVDLFYRFIEGDPCFDEFLNVQTMEKYIGPLDGNNLDRNLGFIKKILNENEPHA